VEELYKEADEKLFNKILCKAQIPLGSTRHVRLCRASRVDMTRHVRVCRAVLFQHGGRRRSSSACMYKFSVLCFERTCT